MAAINGGAAVALAHIDIATLTLPGSASVYYVGWGSLDNDGTILGSLFRRGLARLMVDGGPPTMLLFAQVTLQGHTDILHAQ